MGTLAFFPWFRLPSDFKPIRAAGFELLRYENEQYTEADAEAVAAVLVRYAEKQRQQLDEAVLLRAVDRELTDDLDDATIEAAFQFAEIVAFSGCLSASSCSHSGYSNRDTYRLIIQWFDKPGKGALQRTWRRDGVSMVTFNIANTDNSVIAQHVELALSSGALEKVLGSNHGKERQLASAFTKSLNLSGIVDPENCPRAMNVKEKSTTIRDLWVRDLFRYRNEFAHGNVVAKRPRLWNIREHLLLSSYVFPLVMKAQLALAGFYKMTDSDHLAVDTFEPLACADDLFMRTADGEFIWHEITDRVRNAHRRKRTLAALRKAFPRK